MRQSADVAEDFITYFWVGDKLSNRRDGIFNLGFRVWSPDSKRCRETEC